MKLVPAASGSEPRQEAAGLPRLLAPAPVELGVALSLEPPVGVPERLAMADQEEHRAGLDGAGEFVNSARSLADLMVPTLPRWPRRLADPRRAGDLARFRKARSRLSDAWRDRDARELRRAQRRLDGAGGTAG